MPLWLAIIIAIPLGYLTILGILSTITMILYNGPSDTAAQWARRVTHWWATPVHYFFYAEWFARR
ncbi:MAG: hypothetical protein A2991_01260 [Candidatus Terrybacteria bacterium RIFCSPLOWO2_01_FULL_58_14]|uniref:Uncharacterized protein n=1 Tax=Candidatus Terrybacteria bacterium RIFCSPLOWO2_01_FULL_58_14 TaxID=1802369 RepID=A0A1G2Q2I6_9BACT|nr:MAG: hypothetical protein A2991_01260 [Candidatus Terrybacteria bacterium RIFCSPLOWO2_01_FULL_58_14]